MQAEAALATTSRSAILGAIQHAAHETGADFNYLLGTAIRESGLKATAQASTSSAAGLFQFLDQTWLGMIKNYGAKYGLGSYANAITQGADGRYHTTDSADRTAILALRKDPGIASLMEGEYAQATRATLQGSLGRDVCGGELYAAHFLGPDAACRLIRMSENQPGASAASAFPAAAGANRNVFYHRDGTPKTVREVYDWALRQPNGTLDAVPAATPSTVPTTVVSNTPTDFSDTSGLLASLVSWSPSHGFFGADTEQDSGVTTTPFLLTPGVMDILSSVGSVAGGPVTH